jgi:hypothetical protein
MSEMSHQPGSAIVGKTGNYEKQPGRDA